MLKRLDVGGPVSSVRAPNGGADGNRHFREARSRQKRNGQLRRAVVAVQGGGGGHGAQDDKAGLADGDFASVGGAVGGNMGARVSSPSTGSVMKAPSLEGIGGQPLRNLDARPSITIGVRHTAHSRIGIGIVEQCRHFAIEPILVGPD